MSVTIVIGGDVYPGEALAAQLGRGRAGEVFGDLVPSFAAADFVLVNLEGPLIDAPSPITKVGPHHGFPSSCLAGLVEAGIDAVNLGNNHSMDHGAAGIENTMRCCQARGMAWVGAGRSRDEAGQPLIREVGGLRLGVLAYTEFEFGIAEGDRPGTCPIDCARFVRTLRRHAKSWDKLIVLLHGGNEYFPYPRPNLRDLARFMCEEGAAAVIFQHSHCAGCWEPHAGGVIVHGQGNLVFDLHRAYPCEMEGFLVRLELDGSAATRMVAIPFAQEPGGLGPRLMAGERKAAFLRDLEHRSRSILQPGFVEAEWDKFAAVSPYNYLSLIHGYPKRVRELDRKFGFLRWVYSRERMRMLLHLIRCESHREAIIQVLTTATRL